MAAPTRAAAAMKAKLGGATASSASASVGASASASGSVRARYSTSTTAPTVVGQRAVTGMVTDTGGSGLDSTALSASATAARAGAVSLYREILREIPAMRENYTVIETSSYVRRVVRGLYEHNAHVSDPKVIDMLVFKGRQEIGEIKNQWKSRNHVYQHITKFKEAERRANLHAGVAADPDAEKTARRELQLALWKKQGLVPTELDGWAAYEHWIGEQNAKFAGFAEQNNLFSQDDINQNNLDKNRCAMV